MYRCSFLVLFMHLLSVVFLLLFILFYSFFLLLRFCLVSYGLYRIFCAHVVIVHWLLWLCFFKVRHFQTFRFYYSTVLKMDMLTCMNILPKETNDQQFGLFQKQNKNEKKRKEEKKHRKRIIFTFYGMVDRTLSVFGTKWLTTARNLHGSFDGSIQMNEF